MSNNRGGKKRDEMMLYEDRARVAQLMHEGLRSPRDIAKSINDGRPEHLQVSHTTISNDIKWLKQQWKESGIYDFDAARNQMIEELDYIKSEAWAEWHKSKTPKPVVTTESSPALFDEEGEDNSNLFDENQQNITKVVRRVEPREGNVAYLQLVERIIERQCKILGIDAPNKLALTDTSGKDIINVKNDVLSRLKDIGQRITEDNKPIIDVEATEIDSVN